LEIGQNVMIVSMDETQGNSIHHVLKQSGFNSLITANSSQAAINLLTDNQFDAIVCAVELKPIDGWRLARIIRSGALTVKPNIPIVMLSDGYSERIALATSKAFQINRFIPYEKFHTLPSVLSDLFRQENPGAPKSSLLVIEDYPDTIELCKRVLSNRFDIDVATTGKMGLDNWRQKRHDLVLLDVMLPEMSGNQVLKEIIKESPTQSVVMMTAQSTPERAAQLIIDGAVDYISKPFRADQLRQVCEIAVQRQDFIISNKEFTEHEQALHQEKELAQITLQSIADAVIRTNASGQIEYMNPAAELITGWSLLEARDKLTTDVFACYFDNNNKPASSPIDTCLNKQSAIFSSPDITYLSRDGTKLKLDYITSPIKNRNSEIIGAVMVFRDITEEHELAQKLDYQAKHDTLTGLTNRPAFEDHLEKMIDAINRNGGEHALCYIDLDQFKVVNDTCGHIAGDQLLQKISNIILNKIRQNRDTLARFGGDEFVLLLSDCPVDQARRIADEICKEIKEYSFVYDYKTFAIGASIGIVPINIKIANVNDALRMADNACYVAKEKGRNRVHIYHADDHEMVRRSGEMHVISKINHALENNGFSLFYQDIQSLADGHLGKHIEILIRMNDENGDWITPGFFLPAAERYSIAPKIDRWVVSSLMSWLSENNSCLEQIEMCSINLSGLSFSDHDFSDFVKNEIQSKGIPAKKICFEITETAAIGNLQDAADFIHTMKQFGCSFALDDFGSGMSSYAYLKALPVDYLKIDGMFVKDILIDPIDKAMVKSINEIGHVFGLKTIAEFVENIDIMTDLKALGVDFAQGYAISKPTPIINLLTASA